MKALRLVALFASPCLIAAPARLSGTGLYDDTAGKHLAPGVERFDPQYPLWSDGARKTRYVALPAGARIDTSDPDHWTFPVGTKLWKEFAFEIGGKLRRVETRFEHKTSETDWELKTYLWDPAEGDATLAPEAGVPDYVATGPGLTHDIPSTAQCLQCHRRGGDPVLGFEAIQLSDDRDPNAPGAEPLAKDSLTLAALVKRQLVTETPPVLATAPRIHAATADGRAALGYLHANCGSCHNPSGTAGHTGLDLRHTLDVTSPAEEPGFQSAVGRYTTVYQLPGQKKSYQIQPGDPDHSAVVYRMRLSGAGRMPQIGTKKIHAPAVELLARWVRGLKP